MLFGLNADRFLECSLSLRMTVSLCLSRTAYFKLHNWASLKR